MQAQQRSKVLQACEEEVTVWGGRMLGRDKHSMLLVGSKPVRPFSKKEEMIKFCHLFRAAEGIFECLKCMCILILLLKQTSFNISKCLNRFYYLIPSKVYNSTSTSHTIKFCIWPNLFNSQQTHHSTYSSVKTDFILLFPTKYMQRTITKITN